MNNRNVIALDLAKNIIQIAKVSKHGEILLNKAQSPAKIRQILANSPPSIVAMEGCGSFHYWGRIAQSFGHEVRGMSPRHVKPYVSKQKTDANDAIGIAIAAMQPNMSFSPVKTIEQQILQTLTVSRKFLDKQLTQLSNHIRALFYEYGIPISRSKKALKDALHDNKENNVLPDILKPLLSILTTQYMQVEQSLRQVTRNLEQLVAQNEQCQRIIALEGIGPLSAAGLVATLSQTGHFKSGRCASVYLGVTPKQFSSGGKTMMLGIDKSAGDKQLKSTLFLGALSYISSLPDIPQTQKQRWLLALVARSGVKRACIALVNKNIRTVWAMLKNGTPYQPIMI
jgi:transposase